MNREKDCVMEGIKGGGGGGKVDVGEAAAGDHQDINYCINHPFKNNNNGGICAFCLQEKLGKLLLSSSSSSSSSPLPLRASSSSSPSSPPDACAREGGVSGVGVRGGTSLSMSAPRPTTTKDDNVNYHREYHARRPTGIPLPKKKIMASSSSDHHHDDGRIVLKRSKSTVITPRSGGRFWSFLYLSSKTTTQNNAKKPDKIASIMNDDEDDDDDDVRKVSRSRSVGCGSRSFSGDFFEKISTGFGDCTLRRVESQREGKPKLTAPSSSSSSQRVKCGGIFGGSSSSYWVSSATTDHQNYINDGKSKSWVWSFASPIRVFSSSSGNKKDKNSNTATTTPDLSAIPSLLAVRS